MPHFETLLHGVGLALAIEPLRTMFEREGLDDPWLRYVLTREMIEHTAAALTVFTKPRVVH